MSMLNKFNKKTSTTLFHLGQPST